ncbi:Protein hu-li tai shao [Halotydeus destructor]|nr:Protein hu-li tai shao [Halotydeus destructor]
MSTEVEINGQHTDGEDEQHAMRPVDIEQDVKEMERRKRVEVIMNSQVFREELERIIDGQLNEGYLPASLSALHQVTELLLPHNARNSNNTRFGHTSIPINDIRGVDALRYAKGEKLIRCKLASIYRLVDFYGWSMGIYNHITVRVSQEHEHFLLNPFGLMYHEITASSLVKVDLQGNVVDPGSTSFGFNKAGFVLHSAIHTARPDIKAIIHVHHSPCVAVSSMKCGLLAISQEAAIIGDVSYHDYRGILVDTEERELITKNLGVFNKVMMLRNHGALTCGETLEEALYLMNTLIQACETQVKLMPIGIDNIQMMSEDARQQAFRVARKEAGANVQIQDNLNESSGEASEEKGRDKAKKWKIWDLEFEAQMRMLDNAGYRSGYIYRQPLIRLDQQRPKYDVEIPPAASSLAQYFDEDKWLSPLKKLVDSKKTQDRLRWVNSPNTYNRVEVEETGTRDPKKITKWVQDGSPQHSSNPIKIESAHQFVPVNVDPSEFKRKQKEMKAIRFQNKISSGPQSNILDGVSYEEAKRMQEEAAKDGRDVVMVGAASKGIIQRDFQYNAMVYKSAYARNPFDNVTDADLEDYKQYVEKKQRGEPVDDVPEHVRHLLMEPIDEQLLPPNELTSPTDPKSIQSPTSDEEASSYSYSAPSPSSSRVQRSSSARLAAQAIEDTYFARKYRSERRPKRNTSDSAVNGEDSKIGDISGASRSSKEGSPVKDLSQSDKSSKKDKKKKGLRTPSFLKSKKKNKKDKEEA